MANYREAESGPRPKSKGALADFDLMLIRLARRGVREAWGETDEGWHIVHFWQEYGTVSGGRYRVHHARYADSVFLDPRLDEHRGRTVL